MEGGNGVVKSWPVLSDKGFRVRVYVQTGAAGAKSTVSVTNGDDAIVEGKYDEYVLKTSTSSTSNAFVTIASNSNTLY